MQTITNKPTKFKNMKQINKLLSQTIVNRSKKTALILALLVTAGTSFSFANGTNGFANSTNNVTNGTNNVTNSTNSITNGTGFAKSTATVTKDSNGTRHAQVVNNPSNAYNTDGLTRKISLSFTQDFKNARLINSEAHSNFTKLTFRMNDMVLFAYYSDNGRLLAVIRNILSSQLPTELMTNLKSNYSDYWITELFELNGEGQNCYYVSLENADTKLVLRSTGDNTWEIYQQTDKNQN